MTKVLWFSRHTMTEEQKKALTDKLGQIQMMQVNGSPANVHVPFEGEVDGIAGLQPAVKELCQNCDVLAIVAPIGLQEQFLKISGGKPVIIAQTKRQIIKGENGTEDKVNFVFDGWKQLKKIEIVMEDFI